MVRIKKGKERLTVPMGSFKSIFSREGWQLDEVAKMPEAEEIDDDLNDDDSEGNEDDNESERDKLPLGYESYSEEITEEIPEEIKELLKISPVVMEKEQVKTLCAYFGMDVKGKKKDEILVLLQELIDNVQ